MASDVPLDSDEPRLTAVPIEGSSQIEPPVFVAARPWGPWASIGWTLLTVAVFIGVQTVTVSLFVVIQMASGSTVDAQELKTNGNLIATATLTSMPAVIGLVAILIYVRGCSIRDYLAVVRPTIRQGLTATVGLILLLAAIVLTAWLLSRPPDSPFMDAVYRTAWLPLLILALVVAAPLSEEVLFRGFLFRGLAQSRRGAGLAIVLSSLGWTALHVHYDWFDLGTIFFVGLYFGWVRYRSGSLLLTILLHALYNAIATIDAMVRASD